MSKRDWRAWEEEQLERLYIEGASANKIHAALPHRTPRAINAKIYRELSHIEDLAKVERMVELAFRGMA